MTAQEKLLEYARQHNTTGMTDQNFIGQAMVEGVVISRTPMSKTICNVQRTGKTIVITETLIKKVDEVIDHKLAEKEVKTVSVVLTVEL